MDYRREFIERQARMGVHLLEMPVVSRNAVGLPPPRPAKREVVAFPVAHEVVALPAARDVLHLSSPKFGVADEVSVFRAGLAARAFARGAFAAMVEGKPTVMRIWAVIGMVSEISGVPVKEITSASRSVKIIRPRMIAAWACRHWSAKSMPEIGLALGGRDHTTAMHSVAVVEHLAQRLGVHPDDNKQAVIGTLVSATEHDWQWAKNARTAEKVRS